MPQEQKCYIVFRGKPSAWYVHEDSKGEPFRNAEEEAARRALEEEEDYTILCIPKESLEMGMIAKYHGVVLHALKNEDIN
jgi:hypothetical protein